MGEPIDEDDAMAGGDESAPREAGAEEDASLKQGPRGSEQPGGSPPQREQGTGTGDGMVPRRKRLRAVDMFADSDGEGA